MQPLSAKEHVNQLYHFVAHDLPGLSTACEDERLPLARLLHHARRQTVQVQVSLDLLDLADRRLMHGCLLEILRACDMAATMRNQPRGWAMAMLPDLATALSSATSSAPVCPARVQGG